MVESTTVSSSEEIIQRNKGLSMYAVVTLQDSDEVMVAASNWLSTDKKQSYWPPFRSEEKCVEAAQKRFKPETDGRLWEKLNINFHKQLVSFDEAKKEQKEIQEQKERHENTQEMAKNPLRSVTLASTSRLTPEARLVSTTDMDANLKTLQDIKKIVEENSAMLKKLMKDNAVSDVPSSTSAPSKDVDTILNLPLRTIQDLSRTESELKDPKTRKKYIKSISQLGGFGPRDVIKNIMQHLITDDLANDFNWQGRGHKNAFSRLILADVIREAASIQNVLRVDCETEIKNYLWSIPDRIGRKRPRDYVDEW
ncbi:uncharacterized protein LOC130246932 isoform X2 [Danio aesculapii]|uniref:uncharacterized protein LOC130246932 isoform X2 n=1 Tax=Danio aesculapii TaxID=1142201 RepID=UPI0024C0D348|nr:uncharacterized protein LOC130246932 isoform X2 [Danio aesculapii]